MTHPFSVLPIASAISLLAAVPSLGATAYVATLTGSQVVGPTDSTATAIARLTLNDDNTELAYDIQFFGLNLEEMMADRTKDEDITKLHIHTGLLGNNGPHTLNIFGLPGEDDADLVVDYTNNTLSGIWDDGDVQGTDPLQPGQTKRLSDFITELNNGGLYIQAHSVAFPDPGDIRGQIAVIPEPGSALLLTGGLLLLGFRRSR